VVFKLFQKYSVFIGYLTEPVGQKRESEVVFADELLMAMGAVG
jgi:hypothetical protein